MPLPSILLSAGLPLGSLGLGVFSVSGLPYASPGLGLFSVLGLPYASPSLWLFSVLVLPVVVCGWSVLLLWVVL